MKNEGKSFESDFEKSIPEHIFRYRLRDAGGWSDATNTRFTPSNICDFIVHYEGNLFLLELKSNKGNSMPITNVINYKVNKTTGEKELNWKKINDLIEAGNKDGVVSGYVINFRETEETYFITAFHFKEILLRTGKKSINRNDLINGGNSIKIEQEKIRVRNKYNVDKFLYEAIPF